jgi:hypothetical protein
VRRNRQRWWHGYGLADFGICYRPAGQLGGQHFLHALFHHIGEAAHRKTILSEFQRVSRDSVILSCGWMAIQGLAPEKASSAAAPRPKDNYQNRFVLPAETVEEEFTAAGFRIRNASTSCRSMWRVYVLRKG